jgi:hypothetical protein
MLLDAISNGRDGKASCSTGPRPQGVPAHESRRPAEGGRSGRAEAPTRHHQRRRTRRARLRRAAGHHDQWRAGLPTSIRTRVLGGPERQTRTTPVVRCPEGKAVPRSGDTDRRTLRLGSLRRGARRRWGRRHRPRGDPRRPGHRARQSARGTSHGGGCCREVRRRRTARAGVGGRGKLLRPTAARRERLPPVRRPARLVQRTPARSWPVAPRPPAHAAPWWSSSRCSERASTAGWTCSCSCASAVGNAP